MSLCSRLLLLQRFPHFCVIAQSDVKLTLPYFLYIFTTQRYALGGLFTPTQYFSLDYQKSLLIASALLSIFVIC
jgi:hypothetical protein